MSRFIEASDFDSEQHSNLGQIRVLLIEDDEALRDSLANYIRRSPALNCVGAFANAEEALQNAGRLSPQVAVIDMKLPGMDGVACTTELKQMLPECEVLVLTVYDDTDLILEAIKAGARGYLLKHAVPEKLLSSIMAVCEGGAPMTPAIARKVLESFKPKLNAADEGLSSKEIEILQLLSQGQTVKSVPSILHISESTVRFHLRNIYKKLQATGLFRRC